MTFRGSEGGCSGSDRGGAGRAVAAVFSAREWALVEAVAAQRGERPEVTAQALVCEGIARRVRKRLGRGPSAAVLRFARGR